MSTTLTPGKTYNVISSRKGTFTGNLVRADDTWATIKITSGRADAMLAENVCNVGEEVTVRRSLCNFAEVAA